ncbi:MAG: hypothetical protein ACREJC_08890, partial [Tepidisphaeraceae bacterium]
LHLDVPQQPKAGARVTLTAPSNLVQVFTAAQGGTDVTNHTWVYGQPPPETLYVKAIHGSTVLDEAEFVVSDSDGGASPPPSYSTNNEAPTTATTLGLDKVTVKENATQSGVDTEHHPEAWAAVKKADDFVIVKAVLDSNLPENQIPEDKVTWTGGQAVDGHKLQRRVSRAEAAKTTVKCKIGGKQGHVDVWVVWSTVSILTTGTTPPNAVQFGNKCDGTENLGAVRFDNGDQGAGKIVAVGTLAPAGVAGIVTSGWMLTREKWEHTFQDGASFGAPNWDAGWVDDTSFAEWLRVTPDAEGKIYDIDGPNIHGATAADSVERYINFKEWATFNGERASDDALWCFTGGWKIDANPKVTWVEVGTGNFQLPGENGHIYPVVV